MLVSKHWLEQYVDIPKKVTPDQLAADLTLQTVEIESVEQLGQDLEKIVVGVVDGVQKHPNADKLNICTVDFGEKSPVQVVCGGVNVREGMTVALAMVGAKVRWHGEGDLIEIKKTEIRGAKSYGMICASDEIGLGEQFPKSEDAEILDLSAFSLTPGTLLKDALQLDDIVLEIDNKSMTHRPDLWGHYGVAREVAAIYDKSFKELPTKKITAGKELSFTVDVEVKDRCRAYAGVAMSGITIEPSPAWMQARLLAAGVRPINNIVDITNYVMMELGQPTHAFDVDNLASPDIIVRAAKKGEKFTTLDDKERELDDYMFVIADKKKAIALGGVMGGQNTEVSDTTTTVWFESANFEPTTIRRTSKQLGLRTEGSSRWEKNQDPTNAIFGLQRLVELTRELCPDAKVVSNVVDDVYMDLDQGPIELPLEFLARRVGIDIPKKDIVAILTIIGFGVKEKKDSLSVTIPTWRATKDIAIPEDLVEEVARLYEYKNIPTTLPRFEIRPPARNRLREIERTITQHLAHEAGYTEMKNYSFASPDWLNKFGEDLSKFLELENPIAKDRPYLRRHLIHGLLENVEANLHRYDSVRLFEIGRVYWKEEKGEATDNAGKDFLPKQDTMLGMTFAAKGVEVPFHEAMEVSRRILDLLGVDYVIDAPEVKDDAIVHPYRYAEFMVGKESIGQIAELNPLMQQKLGIPHRTAIVQINLSRLLEHVSDVSNYSPLSTFPAVSRDIAFVVERNTVHDNVAQAIEEINDLIVAVEIFDVYEGKHVDAGQKSMAYRVTYQAPDRTLESAEVDGVHAEVVKMLEKKFGAQIRK